MKLEDVKVGMKVRVIGTQKSRTGGWKNSWIPEMNPGVGRTFEVLSVRPFAQGIVLKEINPEPGHNPLDYWCFPWQVLEPVEPVEQSTGHPHADLMAQYAEDAKVTDKPWELWQYNDTGIWVGSSYGGFVTKVDEFQTKDACVQFARDIQSRHGKDGVYIKGNPICVQRKSSQSGHTQKDQQRAIAR